MSVTLTTQPEATKAKTTNCNLSHQLLDKSIILTVSSSIQDKKLYSLTREYLSSLLQRSVDGGEYTLYLLANGKLRAKSDPGNYHTFQRTFTIDDLIYFHNI